MKATFNKLIGINDSSQRIALGFGCGLFLGVFPGTGVLAALAAAFILPINKVATVAGAVLVNTWINVITFPIATVIGAFLFRLDPAAMKQQWFMLLKNFSWNNFLHIFLQNTILAIMVGYTVVGILLAVIGYCTLLFFITKVRKNKTPQ